MLSLGPRFATAAPFDPSADDWEGYADFIRLVRSELGSQRVAVTGRLDWSTLTPEDALILVYPGHGVSPASAGAFVRAGGRLVILDDFGASDELLGSFDIDRVPLPTRPSLALRDNPDLPVAEPGASEQALTRGVERVVANHATGLRQPRLTTVLRVRGEDGSETAVSLAASSGQGRVLAVGDPSLFMNSMLRYAGNHTFASNLVQYLAEGHPTGTVSIVGHEFVESSSLEGARGTRTVVGREAWRKLRQALGTVGQGGSPPWLLYGAAIALASLVFRWVVRHTLRVYRSLPARFTRPTPLDAQGGVAGRAAALHARRAYRGYALLEWREALRDDVEAHLGISRDASTLSLVQQLAQLGVVEGDAKRALEHLLLRVTHIETMIAAKQTRAEGAIREAEVVAAGELVLRVLRQVREKAGVLP